MNQSPRFPEKRFARTPSSLLSPGGLRLMALCMVLSLSLAGCCFKMYKDVFFGLVKNAKAVAHTVELLISHQYYTAVNEVFKVVSSINTSCPPRAIPPEKLSRLPIEVDFNLLHEYLDAGGQVRVATVPPTSPDEIVTEADLSRLYGISESDNYKFVFATHQDLYVYIFQIDATGEVAWQFPREVTTADGTILCNPWHDAQGVNPVTAERVLRMPAHDDDWLYFNENGRNGVENFFLIASKVRQIELEEALAAAVEAAALEKAGDPNKFTETAIKLPLIVPKGQSGLTNQEGSASAKVSTIQTEQGPVSYTPRSFDSKDDTIVIARSVLHLPERGK